MQNLEQHDVSTLPSQYSPQQGPTRPSRGLRTAAILALTLLLAAVFGTGLFAGWEFGSRNTTISTSRTGVLQPWTNRETARETAIAKIRPAVVQVTVATQRGVGLGSGVIIDRQGYIVTNSHVIDGAQAIEVMLSDGTKVPAQLVGKASADDLAVLRISVPGLNLTVATFGDSSQLQVGQDVLAIGNPLGITQTVTSGIVSALGRKVATIPDAIQTDAAINPGNSGGALVDLQGNLVGIPTYTAIDPEFQMPATGVGFAIPSNRVQSIVSQIIKRQN